MRHAGAPSGRLRPSPAPTRRRAIVSIGRWVADSPMRWGRCFASASRRSSVRARCEPRLSRATAWISSTITVRTPRRRSRLRAAVTRRYRDSGVVIRRCGGCRSIAARAAGGVSPVRATDAELRDHQPELPGHLPDLGQRALEVLPDVGGQRLERRHVDDLGRRLGVRVGLGGAEQPVDADEERRQRLAGAGRRRDQRVVAGRDRGPAERLRVGRPVREATLRTRSRMAGWKPASASIEPSVPYGPRR